MQAVWANSWSEGDGVSALLTDTIQRRGDALMKGIRPCERADLPEVASLYEYVMRSGTRNPPLGLAEYFERTFFDCPWTDPEIPPLVYKDGGGRIIGFLGSHVRRLRLDGHPIRLACGRGGRAWTGWSRPPSRPVYGRRGRKRARSRSPLARCSSSFPL